MNRIAYLITHPKAWKHLRGELRFRFVTLPRAAYERARYGWSKWDIHGPGFDGSVVPAIGKQLIYFSENTVAYPGHGEYDTPEKWSTVLRTNGEALVRSAEDVPMPQILSDYYGGVTIEGNRMVWPDESEEVVSARETHWATERQRSEDGAKAMHWLADHYKALWD